MEFHRGAIAVEGVAKLYDEVEHRYGHVRLLTEVIQGQQDGFGSSTITDAGEAAITISPNNPAWETTLAHELWHLILRREGYPVYHYHFADDLPLDNYRARYMVSEIKEPLLHAVFFPRIRELGLDPAGNMKRVWKTRLETDTLWDAEDSVRRAVKYFRILRECDDDGLAASLRECFCAKGWEDAIAKAHQALRIAEQFPNNTPEGHVEAVLAAGNFMVADLCALSLREWTTHSFGPHIDRKVVFDLTLPNGSPSQ